MILFILGAGHTTTATTTTTTTTTTTAAAAAATTTTTATTTINTTTAINNATTTTTASTTTTTINATTTTITTAAAVYVVSLQALCVHQNKTTRYAPQHTQVMYDSCRVVFGHRPSQIFSPAGHCVFCGFVVFTYPSENVQHHY